MAIGELVGILVGATFPDRRALYDAGVHRALQKGIVGREDEGAESIVLSGGYVDDEDEGDLIIYTGEGGRDQASRRQVSAQELRKGNLALVTSALQGKPVRVVRGGEHQSRFSPPQGYRYDGLFSVDSYWSELGRDGFLIWRYKLVALDQRELAEFRGNARPGPARRSSTTVLRIVRDTAISRSVKLLHDYHCQICGERINCVGGPYAEAAHIKPLGAPHDGPDELGNVLCLCPNHHVMLDRGFLTITDDLVVRPLGSRVRQKRGHTISVDHLQYHRQLWMGAGDAD
jgi:putative restriction endonuclease